MCRMINNKLKYKHYCSIVESSTFCFHYLHGCCSFDMAIYAWGQIPVHFLLQPLSSWKHRVQPHNCAISAVNSKVAIFFTRPTYRTRCAVTFIFLLLVIFGLKAFWRKWLRICPTHKQNAELVHLMDWVIQAIAGSLLQKKPWCNYNARMQCVTTHTCQCNFTGQPVNDEELMNWRIDWFNEEIRRCDMSIVSNMHQNTNNHHSVSTVKKCI